MKVPGDPPTIWSDLWEEWFSDQYAISDLMTRAVDHAGEGKPDAFRLALWAAIIEHAAETMRGFIPLVDPPAFHVEPYVPSTPDGGS